MPPAVAPAVAPSDSAKIEERVETGATLLGVAPVLSRMMQQASDRTAATIEMVR